MTRIDGGELLTRTLVRHGVREVFTLHGGHLDAAYQAPSGRELRWIDTRHEQAAGHAADGWARTTGRVGVAMVTAGPGVTDVVTAVANAYLDCIPTLFLGGRRAAARRRDPAAPGRLRPGGPHAPHHQVGTSHHPYRAHPRSRGAGAAHGDHRPAGPGVSRASHRRAVRARRRGARDLPGVPASPVGPGADIRGGRAVAGAAGHGRAPGPARGRRSVVLGRCSRAARGRRAHRELPS